MSEESGPFSIKRAVIASNITGTVLAEYILQGYHVIKNDRAIVSLFQTLALIAKEFDDGELQLVSFGPTSGHSSSPMSSTSISLPQGPESLNLALFMENGIIAGILYSYKGDDVPQEYCDELNTLTKKLHKAFSDDHLDFYLSKKVQEQLNTAFQLSEEIPADVKDRFASFTNKIPRIIDPSCQNIPASPESNVTEQPAAPKRKSSNSGSSSDFESSD